MIGGMVSKSNLAVCREYIMKCLEIGESFDYEQVYPDNYMEAISLLICIQSEIIKSKVFDRLNIWFCGFANGIPEYNMMEKDRTLYGNLMTFSTNFCWEIDSRTWGIKEEVYLLTVE